MKSRWNHPLWAGLLVVLLAFLSYFLVFAHFPVTRDVPWVNLLLFAVGILLLVIGVRRAYRQPEVYRGKIRGPIFLVLGLAVAGLFVFYTVWFSKQLPAAVGTPQVGQKAPDFTLPDQNGQPVTLSQVLAEPKQPWVLLVFYRGYW
jgi:hypothetical protein